MGYEDRPLWSLGPMLLVHLLTCIRKVVWTGRVRPPSVRESGDERPPVHVERAAPRRRHRQRRLSA